jgi:hypothetical protein
MAQKSPAVWPWVLGLIVVLAAAAIYTKTRGKEATAGEVAAADSGQLATAADDNTGGGPGGGAGDSMSPAAPAAPSQPQATSPTGAAAVAPRDSGAIRLRNLPVGSRVLIDERPATTAVTRVPAGRRVIAISAPQHNFFADTVTVRRGDTLLLSPALTRLGQTPSGRQQAVQPPPKPEQQPGDDDVAEPCLPGASYEARECFDSRPRPLSSPLVTVPDGVPANVVSAAFWVRVTDAGQTSDVLPLRSSGSVQFDSAARAVARTMTWDPAQKDGAAVPVWTQMQFPASR